MKVETMQYLGHILELLRVAEDLISLQRMVSFSTVAERRAAKDSIALLRMVRAMIMTLPLRSDLHMTNAEPQAIQNRSLGDRAPEDGGRDL